jgi:IS5 family transposase
MIIDRYEPVNLFEMVSKLNLQFEPELAQLDELLEDDVFFERVKADFAQRHPNSKSLGRHSTPVEVKPPAQEGEASVDRPRRFA